MMYALGCAAFALGLGVLVIFAITGAAVWADVIKHYIRKATKR